MNKPKVLFLCTGNSGRSQMAEKILRAQAGDQFDIYSAGVEPKGYILPEVLAVMRERGYDMNGQSSKSVKEYLGKMHFAYVITLCADAEENCPTVFLNMGQHEHWPFDDPAAFDGPEAEHLAFVRQIRDQIEARLQQWLASQGVPATGT
jgi:arsenate reductase